MKNWFNTLNEALDSEELAGHWDAMWPPISYGETRRFDFPMVVLTATGREKTVWHHVSITRETNGMYERPVHYTL